MLWRTVIVDGDHCVQMFTLVTLTKRDFMSKHHVVKAWRDMETKLHFYTSTKCWWVVTVTLHPRYCQGIIHNTHTGQKLGSDHCLFQEWNHGHPTWKEPTLPWFAKLVIITDPCFFRITLKLAICIPLRN